jgi:peptidoglycan-N-acetylglucosamine deacetylase
MLSMVLLVTVVPGTAASDVLSHGSRARHWIALTFDDGWNAARCAQIADTLRKRKVTATFLPNGTYVRAAPKRWRAILRGFPVANHTLTHAWLDRLSAADIRREISANETAIELALGRPMLHLLRPPYGAYDQHVVDVADALGYRTVLWDVDSFDTSTPSSATIAHNASQGINGSIVLLHCGPSATPAAVGSIISSYRARGFRFVDLATMLGLSPPAPAMACRVRNAETHVTKGNLQAAVRAASAGDHLVLRGTCRGKTTIGKRLTIRGTRTRRSRAPTLAGMDHGPVLTVRTGTTATLTGITIRGGAADRAAGILNLGRLTLKDVVVRGNEARVAGGAIANKGQLWLRGSTSIRGNRSGGHAGGILNWGSLTMAGSSSITLNEAATSGGGLFERGSLTGVRCGENVRQNVPDDCVGA